VIILTLIDENKILQTVAGQVRKLHLGTFEPEVVVNHSPGSRFKIPTSLLLAVEKELKISVRSHRVDYAVAVKVDKARIVLLESKRR
jgi:hypothetical protein